MHICDKFNEIWINIKFKLKNMKNIEKISKNKEKIYNSM